MSAKIIQFPNQTERNLRSIEEILYSRLLYHENPRVMNRLRDHVNRETLLKYLSLPDFGATLEVPKGLSRSQIEEMKTSIEKALWDFHSEVAKKIHVLVLEICLLYKKICELEIGEKTT